MPKLKRERVDFDKIKRTGVAVSRRFRRLVEDRFPASRPEIFPLLASARKTLGGGVMYFEIVFSIKGDPDEAPKRKSYLVRLLQDRFGMTVDAAEDFDGSIQNWQKFTRVVRFSEKGFNIVFPADFDQAVAELFDLFTDDVRVMLTRVTLIAHRNQTPKDKRRKRRFKRKSTKTRLHRRRKKKGRKRAKRKRRVSRTRKTKSKKRRPKKRRRVRRRNKRRSKRRV